MPNDTPSPVAGGAPPGLPPGGPGGAQPAARPSPPFGSSPSVTPNPNQGLEAAAVQRLGVVIKQLTDILPLVGATTEVGEAIMSALRSLGKHVKPGAVTPAAEANQLQRAQLQNAQNGQVLQRLKQMAAGGQGPPGAGGPQQAPQMPRPGMA